MLKIWEADVIEENSAYEPGTVAKVMRGYFDAYVESDKRRTLLLGS